MALLDIDALDIDIGGRPVVRGLSLCIEAGEILGLVGESGSGKSMTALAVMQLLPRPARVAGAIRFGGVSLTSMSEPDLARVRGHRIGIIFQEPMTALNPLMNIGDQVAEVVRIHRGTGRRDALGLARAALDRVGLDAERFSLDRYPHELSGGQRQRVAIAMAVILSPQLLIADEPTTALDVTTQAQILALLKDMAREDGTALILISHDLAVVAQLTQRVAILHEGALVEQGMTREVFRSSTHPYTRALLASAAHPRLRLAKAAVCAEAPLLEVHDVVCEYPVQRRTWFRPARQFRAVDGVSLSVEAGESVGLVGESGSGKSTLLRSVLAVNGIQAGRIHLSGVSLAAARGAQLRRLRRSIQCVFQDPVSSFDPRWRVQRLIAEPLHLLDTPLSARDQRHKVQSLLEQVGLSATDADRYPHEFSGGQRQRIAIARALIVDPALIALDEAVSALDTATRLQILALLAHLSQTLGLAYLFVSHDLGVVRSITDRVFVMQHGRIVESGPTGEVFDAPRHPYTRELLAASPRL